MGKIPLGVCVVVHYLVVHSLFLALSPKPSEVVFDQNPLSALALIPHWALIRPRLYRPPLLFKQKKVENIS